MANQLLDSFQQTIMDWNHLIHEFQIMT